MTAPLAAPDSALSAAVLAADLLGALDASRVFTANGLEPDRWQRDLLGAPPHRGLVLCGRQVGKSTTAAALALHRANVDAGSTVLVAARTERQSVLLLDKARSFSGAWGVPPVDDARGTLTLTNGSRIVAVPGSTPSNLRGFSVQLAVVDEAAFTTDELLAAVRPMLAATGGSLVALSTPGPPVGWFYDAWHDDAEGWTRARVTTPECARIPAAFVDEERRSLPPSVFRREYLAEFVGFDGSAFDPDELRAATTTELEGWQPATAGLLAWGTA